MIPDYSPKNPLPDLKFGKSNKKSHSINYTSGYKYKGALVKMKLDAK